MSKHLKVNIYMVKESTRKLNYFSLDYNYV